MFWHRTKTSKRHDAILDLKKMSLNISFGIDFRLFQKLAHRFRFETNNFDMFIASKSIHFPIKILLLFMFVQNSSQGQFLEGPGADLYWKVGFVCHFGYHFRPKSVKTQDSSSGWERPSRDPALDEP